MIIAPGCRRREVVTIRVDYGDPIGAVIAIRHGMCQPAVNTPYWSSWLPPVIDASNTHSLTGIKQHDCGKASIILQYLD